MEFSRIDEETVRCVMTEQDLKERGIELEDFLKNKEKVQNFFEEIVEEAKREVDYESSSGVLAVQVMPMPENGLAIIFSENPQVNFEGILKNIKDAVSDIKDNLSLGQIENQWVNNREAESKKSPKKGVQPQIRVYRFADFDAVESYCGSLVLEKRIKSQLFKDKETGYYYMAIEKGRTSIKLFNAVCERAVEYADLISDQMSTYMYVQEHFTCILDRYAVSVVNRIANG